MNRDRNDMNRHQNRPLNDGDRRYHVDSGEHGYDETENNRSDDARTRGYGSLGASEPRSYGAPNRGYDDRGNEPPRRDYDQERGYAQPVRGSEERFGEDRGYIGRHRDDQGDWTTQRQPSRQDRAVASMEDRGWGPNDRLTQTRPLASEAPNEGWSRWEPPRGEMRGKGPRNYVRSDQRTHEDVCEALTHDEHVDASQIEVKVEQGVVTLTGTIASRDEKRRMEDVVERVTGVKDVNNQVKVQRHDAPTPTPSASGHNTSAGAKHTRSAPH